MNIAELRQQAMALSEQGDYSGALALLDQEYEQHPGSAMLLYNWRTCMAAMAGQTDRALAILEEALNRGVWYGGNLLTQDRHLASLQELPEFQRLVAQNEALAKAAQEAAVPCREVLEPTGEAPYPLVLAMHGNFSNAAREQEHWQPMAGMGWRVAVLQSTQATAYTAFVWNDQEKAFAEVAQHASELMAAPDIRPNSLVLGGFSMGAVTSIRMALAGKVGARGFIAVGPWFETVDDLREILAAGVPQGLRGYIVVGGQDAVPAKAAPQIKALLEEHGIPCEVELHPDLGHVYPDDFGASLERAVKFICG